MNQIESLPDITGVHANDVNHHIPPPTELSESESGPDEDKRPKRRPTPRTHYDPGLISDAAGTWQDKSGDNRRKSILAPA